MKKTFVLVVLFILPIVAYLFFASGITNFGKLPILTKDIPEINAPSAIKFKENITILGFLGEDIEHKKGNAFNLNEKIYKQFYKFKDFQMVMVVPKGTEGKVAELKKELGRYTDLSKWKFVFMEVQGIKSFFKDLKTGLTLDSHGGTPYVFIIDKDLNLRGRKDDEDEGTKYGFNTASVADLNNKMDDDVRIILTEYRLELKKNNARLKKNEEK